MSDTGTTESSSTQSTSQIGEIIIQLDRRTVSPSTQGADQDFLGIPVRIKKRNQIVVTLRFNSKTLKEQRETKELNDLIKRRG